MLILRLLKQWLFSRGNRFIKKYSIYTKYLQVVITKCYTLIWRQLDWIIPAFLMGTWWKEWFQKTSWNCFLTGCLLWLWNIHCPSGKILPYGQALKHCKYIIASNRLWELVCDFKSTFFVLFLSWHFLKVCELNSSLEVDPVNRISQVCALPILEHCNHAQ